ncbi:hypothetical protein V5O48_014560 [Marasmius crinis-equi]|uniref:Uncharacterized protein n=1 Tax=Marasmius crinis-equi TaxID=585013 RepID=A0ABR3EWX4_9AGAR
MAPRTRLQAKYLATKTSEHEDEPPPDNASSSTARIVGSLSPLTTLPTSTAGRLSSIAEEPHEDLDADADADSEPDTEEELLDFQLNRPSNKGKKKMVVRSSEIGDEGSVDEDELDQSELGGNEAGEDGYHSFLVDQFGEGEGVAGQARELERFRTQAIQTQPLPKTFEDPRSMDCVNNMVQKILGQVDALKKLAELNRLQKEFNAKGIILVNNGNGGPAVWVESLQEAHPVDPKCLEDFLTQLPSLKRALCWCGQVVRFYTVKTKGSVCEGRTQIRCPRGATSCSFYGETGDFQTWIDQGVTLPEPGDLEDSSTLSSPSPARKCSTLPSQIKNVVLSSQVAKPRSLNSPAASQHSMFQSPKAPKSPVKPFSPLLSLNPQSPVTNSRSRSTKSLVCESTPRVKRPSASASSTPTHRSNHNLTSKFTSAIRSTSNTSLAPASCTPTNRLASTSARPLPSASNAVASHAVQPPKRKRAAECQAGMLEQSRSEKLPLYVISSTEEDENEVIELSDDTEEEGEKLKPRQRSVVVISDNDAKETSSKVNKEKKTEATKKRKWAVLPRDDYGPYKLMRSTKIIGEGATLQPIRMSERIVLSPSFMDFLGAMERATTNTGIPEDEYRAWKRRFNTCPHCNHIFWLEPREYHKCYHDLESPEEATKKRRKKDGNDGKDKGKEGKDGKGRQNK